MSASFIFLYGPPGSGKSTLGRHLAQRLELPFFDLDDAIEAEAGLSIPEIFAAEGEPGFGNRESHALDAILRRPAGVVALGGGALLDSGNRGRVETAGRVLCLEADFETLISRMESAANDRPLLEGDTRARLLDLLEARRPHYLAFPLQLNTTTLPSADAAWEAQIQLGLFRVSGMGGSYDVRIASGALDQLGAKMHARGLRGPVALVGDRNIAVCYVEPLITQLQSAGYSVHPLVIPAGEQHKTIETVTKLWEGFLQAHLERSSTVVALGGGVVGDLAGFAAATYLRGVPWVAVPTSLLAMVDSSLGGKTGADLPQGKNLIGAFHSPALILTDPLVLNTLPEAELSNGMAEVVKHGVLGDPHLFDLCSRGWQPVLHNLEKIVSRAAAVKVKVIQEDPYERGPRASLNLGHTLGHALEIASDFRLRHGEAVAIGMVQAARVAERRGIADKGLARNIAAVLRTFKLPTQIPAGLDRGRLLSAIGHDKKRYGGKVKVVLPVRIGEVRWGVPIDDPADLLVDLSDGQK